MNSAITDIMKQLEAIFTPMDEKVLTSTQEWAKGRKAAIAEFKQSEEYQAIRRDAWKLYAKLHAIAGGKTWYAVFQKSTADVEKFVAKNCKAIADSRNAAIAKKLLKAEVTEVLNIEFTHSYDGFNGIFRVNTNSGVKVVKIETIYAGGYNIQCLHLRVLTSIR